MAASSSRSAAGLAEPVADELSQLDQLMTIAITLIGLILLGVAGARIGGAPPARAAVRVLVGGTLALLISMAIGSLTGSAV